MTLPFPMMSRRLLFAVALAFNAAPALAQIVTVPLDPIDPNEVQDGDIAPIVPGLDDGNLSVFDPGLDGELEPLTPRPPGSLVGEDVLTVEEDVVANGTGARLRGLDKLAGTTQDMMLASGETAALGWLQITLGECRYPVDNPSGDAYAWVVIRAEAGAAPIFEGWMVASSPALNALDHARFDVWVINCTTE